THHIAAAHLHGFMLLAVGHQQVFGQAPVEKGTSVIHVLDFKQCALAHAGLGGEGGGDNFVVGVQVHKHLEAGARFKPFWDIAARQKYAPEFSAIEQHASVYGFYSGELVGLADFDHGRVL